MKTLLCSLALIILSATAIGQATTQAAGDRDVSAPTAIPEIYLTGEMADADDNWGVPYTVFPIKPGITLTVPHDPAMGGLAIVTTPLGSWIVDLDNGLGGGTGWNVPAVAGSGTCWMIPYGPPDPDGTWPVQPEYKKITGHGDSLYGAVNDYKQQVAEAIAEGGVPSPGDC